MPQPVPRGSPASVDFHRHQHPPGSRHRPRRSLDRTQQPPQVPRPNCHRPRVPRKSAGLPRSRERPGRPCEAACANRRSTSGSCRACAPHRRPSRIMLSAAIRARSAFVRRRRPLGPSITSSRETPKPIEPSKWTPILPSLSKIQHLRHAHACRMAGSDQKWQEGVGVALTQHQLIVRAAAATFALPKQPEVE